jgi:hypothetical protein
MSVDRQNVTIYAGDDLIMAVMIKSETGGPLAITGTNFVWTLAAKAGGQPVLTKTNADDISITNAAIGAVSILLRHGDTNGLSGPMWHQLVMTDGSGRVSTVTTGTITFTTRT